MRIASVLILAASLTVLPADAPAQTSKAAGAATAQDADKLTTYQADLMEVIERIQTGDDAGALEALNPLIASPLFKELDGQGQYAVLGLQGHLNLQLGRNEEALAVSRRLTAMPQANDDAWLMRISAANRLGDYAEAADGVIRFAALGGEALEAFNDDFIRRLALTDLARLADGADHQNRLIDALFDAGWSHEASALWLLRAGRLVEAGDTDRAAVMAARVTSPNARIGLAVDRRFDALRTASPEAFDVAGALKRDLADKSAAARAPDADLEARTTYTRALMYRGRFDEALTEIEAALDPSGVKADAPAVDPDHLIWALDARSRILSYLGRQDEALADLRRAARRPEHGAQNVSHAINLGWLYHRLGRNEEALDAIADIDDAGLAPFGRMQRRQVQACAEYALGREAEFKISAAWLRENQADDPSAPEAVAVCSGDLAVGAAALLARLADPERRNAALVDIQDFLEVPLRNPTDERDRAYQAALLARPDVMAAIDRYGRIETWPIIGPQF